ncbi:hypothetical protein LSCM1_08169 [Leishmania martiniquensis]|uniref:DUF1279 domain-containing protein n=1 Tax=Leishmania martiniquensis TaxID=1580590 RepID=A0A836KUY5_9TRYP|nr:hypothetical protein LSCM1_08169 [Leishmania martiniquensis]
MLLRRFRVVRPLALRGCSMFMKTVVVEHGVPLSLYYFITNEIIVCVLTYLLHYGYFGKEDLIDLLKYIGASKYIDLNSIEGTSWSLLDGQLVVSARLVANFTAASLFMSLWTPVQLPICIATYPYLKLASQRLLKRRSVSKPINSGC